MIRDIVRDVRELPTRLAEGREQARRWVKRRVTEARAQGEDNLWKLHLVALDRGRELVDRAGGVPVLDKVAPNARDLLQAVEKATLLPPLPEYDELNVRKIIGSLHALDRLGLMRVRHWESEHKARKTILDAVERELERRQRYA